MINSERRFQNLKESRIWKNPWSEWTQEAERILGNLWKSENSCGNFWEYRGICGNLWESLRISGNLREFVLWKAVGICENYFYLFLGICRFVKKSVEIYGNLRESIGILISIMLSSGMMLKKLPPHKVSASNLFFDNTLVRDYLGKCFFDHPVGICGKGSSSAWLWHNSTIQKKKYE